MPFFSNTDSKWILVKDVLFVLVGCLLIARTGLLGTIVGVLAILWYGRDLYYRVKVLTASKASRKQASGPTVQKEESSRPEEGRIKVTDLSGAKEVEFEKE